MENLDITETTKNTLVKFTNKQALLFIIKECGFSLKELISKVKNIRLKKQNYKKLILIPFKDILEYLIYSNVFYQGPSLETCTARSKNTIENICNCLDFLAQENGNRFIFRNLDINLTYNKPIMSRLILKVCYEVLQISKKQSAIQILSYITNNYFIIEFISIYKEKSLKSRFNELNPLLKLVNGTFTYEYLDNNAVLFRITLPFLNTHF